MLLEPPAAADDTLEEEGLEALVGMEGMTTTRLAPAGKARIDGRVREVTSDDSLVEPGTAVRVVDVRGGRLLVGPLVRPSAPL